MDLSTTLEKSCKPARSWPSAPLTWAVCWPLPVPVFWPAFLWLSALSAAMPAAVKSRPFIYSLTFVLGLAIVMSILGAVASLMGTMFGMNGPIWYFILAAVLMVMGLHLAGIIKLKLETSQKFLPQRTGLIGALILGMLFGRSFLLAPARC